MAPVTRGLLYDGADVADVGCGAGLASINLARHFPASRFVGYDVSPASVDAARLNAKEAGVEER